MATIFIERQLRSYPAPTTASTPTVYCVVDVGRPQRQTPHHVTTVRQSVSDDALPDLQQSRQPGGVRFPAVTGPRQGRKNGKQAVSTKRVDRPIHNEVHSCPELERTTDGGSSSRCMRCDNSSHDCTAKTELPCVHAKVLASELQWKQQHQQLRQFTSSSPFCKADPDAGEPLRAWRKRRVTGDGHPLPFVDTVAAKKTIPATARTTPLQRHQQPHFASVRLCPAYLLQLGSSAPSDDEDDLDEVFDKCETWLLGVARANQQQERRRA